MPGVNGLSIGSDRERCFRFNFYQTYTQPFQPSLDCLWQWAKCPVPSQRTWNVLLGARVRALTDWLAGSAAQVPRRLPTAVSSACQKLDRSVVALSIELGIRCRITSPGADNDTDVRTTTATAKKNPELARTCYNPQCNDPLVRLLCLQQPIIRRVWTPWEGAAHHPKHH